jgi:hypothetical protein
VIWNPWKQNRILRERAEKYFNIAGDLQRYRDTLSEVIREMKREAERDKKEINRLLDGYKKMIIALQRIADEEKPSSNATVKRMAAIARVVLNK